MIIPDRTTIQMAKFKGTTDGSGYLKILLKVPGTVGAVRQRMIQGGEGWFDTPHADDYIKVSVSDEDNITGAGAGAEVGTYTDNDVPSANQGWYVPKHEKYVILKKMAHTHGELMGGLYLKIEAWKGDGSVDVFRGNIEWGVD